MSASALPTEIASPSELHDKIENLEHIKTMAKFVGENSNIFLLDVRGREEREKDGFIPHSHNLPLDEIEDAMKNKNDEDFKSKYGFSKPKKDSVIVVSCWAGMRAQKAHDMLKSCGFTHTKVYTGSYKQWYEAEQAEKAAAKKNKEEIPKELLAASAEIDKIERLEHIKAMAEHVGDYMFLLDVRGREEREKDGYIPHSFNLPLDEMENAMTKMEDEDFKKTYGFSKPKKDSVIVVSCWAGMRAQKAHDCLVKCGYTHTKVYSGSYKAWLEEQQ